MKMSTMSSNMEDYLERIYLLIRDRRVARVKDIAESMGVKNPSVNNAVSELKKYGYVEQEPYGYVLLTETGEKEAERIIARHRLLHDFLVHLGVSPETADHDACNMEHYLSDETIRAITAYCDAKDAKEKASANGDSP